MLVPIFSKDYLRWMDQVKACPKWLWKSAVGVALYSMSTFVVLMFSGDMALCNYTSSGFPLGSMRSPSALFTRQSSRII